MDKLDQGNQTENFDDVSILLVDSDAYGLGGLSSLMGHYGYHVDVASGCFNAIERLSEAPHDLLLLDLHMPDMAAYQIMEFLLVQNLPTFLVVISEDDNLSAMSRALRHGADDYLKKPFAPEELLATLNNAIYKIRLKKANKKMLQQKADSEQLHRFVVNNSPDIIFMLDKSGCFQFINKKIFSLLGHEPARLLGKSWLTLVEAAEREKARAFLQSLQANEDASHAIELGFLSAEAGAKRNYFEVSLWPLADNNLPASGLYKVYGAARDITERKESEAFINFQAYHDMLTRLPNRTLFKDRLSLAMTQARRKKHSLAIMFMDLDRFKIINDSLGHNIGDRLLQSVSLRLSDCLRSGDTLSRFGGDEFTLLLPEVASEAAAATIAEKIIEALKAPFFVDQHEIYVGCSIGIVTFPEGGNDMDVLIQNADAAMYHIKQRGKNGYAFYRDEMTIDSKTRLHLERDIRRALEKAEFEVYYQAQLSLQTGDLLGMEALVRWQHPEKGLVFPDSFIPVAEETRLIIEIDRWVMRQACRQMAVWLDSDSNRRELRLGVNCSPLYVEQPGFAEDVLGVLEETGLPPYCLELEITENTILSDMEQTIEKLKRLSHQGISIAIDDFGTGYSSLSYLHKFPIDTLKIDSSFIQSISFSEHESCIVNAVVAMGQGLKLNIIAEGVETPQQLEYLRSLGCHAVQGHLLEQAQPAVDVAKKYWLGNTGPLDNIKGLGL